MSASCETEFQFYGTEAEFELFLNKLKEIEGPKTYNFGNSHYPFTVKEHTIYANNCNCRNVWGDNYLDPDDDIYKELAKVVPDAAFDVSSSRLYEGGGGGCETYLRVHFKDRKLTFKSQVMVDTMSLAELCSPNGWDDEEHSAIVLGETTRFDTIEELKEYFEDYCLDIVTDEDEFDYIICNNTEEFVELISQYTNQNVSVLSEDEAILKFGDVYDFDEEDREELANGITFETFGKLYHLDDDVTEEAFNETKEHFESFTLYNDNHVGFDGPWDISEYILKDNGQFTPIE